MNGKAFIDGFLDELRKLAQAPGVSGTPTAANVMGTAPTSFGLGTKARVTGAKPSGGQAITPVPMSTGLGQM